MVFLPLLFPDGRLPSRRWWPLGLAGALAMAVPTVVLAVATWPLRGPGLVPQDGKDPDLVTAVFGITLLTALTLGAIAVAAATLAVATLFQPARRRVQQAVDHTMRPTAMSLWLRPSAADPAPASPPARA